MCFLEITSSFYDEREDNTIETEEQFLLEPVHTKNGDRYVMVNTRLDCQC